MDGWDTHRHEEAHFAHGPLVPRIELVRQRDQRVIVAEDELLGGHLDERLVFGGTN